MYSLSSRAMLRILFVCVDCSVFGEGSAPLCEGCSNDIHQTLSAPHNIKSIVSGPPHSQVVL